MSKFLVGEKVKYVGDENWPTCLSNVIDIIETDEEKIYVLHLETDHILTAGESELQSYVRDEVCTKNSIVYAIFSVWNPLIRGPDLHINIVPETIVETSDDVIAFIADRVSKVILQLQKYGESTTANRIYARPTQNGAYSSGYEIVKDSLSGTVVLERYTIFEFDKDE